jgi:hypothetical protein
MIKAGLFLLFAVAFLAAQARAQAAPVKKCTKPKWKHEINMGVPSPYKTFKITGMRPRAAARSCRAKCMADIACMAYELKVTARREGDCTLFKAGKMSKTGDPRMFAGVCKILDIADPDEVLKDESWKIEEGLLDDSQP